MPPKAAAMTNKPGPPARPPVPSPAPAYTAQPAGQNAPPTAKGLSKTTTPGQNKSKSIRPAEERSTTGGKATVAKGMSTKG
ncbi:hypothetical protein VPH35_090961 [Triticum aestivum]